MKMHEQMCGRAFIVGLSQEVSHNPSILRSEDIDKHLLKESEDTQQNMRKWT